MTTPVGPATRTEDPFLRLLEHAAKRPKMTKRALLADAEMGDEAYINAAAERDMAEAYLDTLRAGAQKAVAILEHTSDHLATDARLTLLAAIRGEDPE